MADGMAYSTRTGGRVCLVPWPCQLCCRTWKTPARPQTGICWNYFTRVQGRGRVCCGCSGGIAPPVRPETGPCRAGSKTFKGGDSHRPPSNAVVGQPRRRGTGDTHAEVCAQDWAYMRCVYLGLCPRLGPRMARCAATGPGRPCLEGRQAGLYLLAR